MHPLGFYANKAQLTTAGINEMPTDDASFKAAVTALQGAGGVPQPFWVTATWPAHLMFTSLINQFGGSIYNPEGTKATVQLRGRGGVAELADLVHHVRRQPGERGQRRAGRRPSGSNGTR